MLKITNMNSYVTELEGSGIPNSQLWTGIE